MLFKISQNFVEARGNRKELQLLRKHLTLPVANAYFARRSRRGWDGNIRFFGWRSKRFPYGLWPQVKSYLIRGGIEYKAFTSRRPLDPLDNISIGDINLYDHQIMAVNKWFRKGGSGIIWSGAGSGKTEMAAAVINQLLKRKLIGRALFIVNGLDLLEQASSRLHLRLGLDVGRVSGSGVSLNSVVTVAAIQKLHRLIKAGDIHTSDFLRCVDLLVYDESHHGRSEQTSVLVRNCPAKYRLGISARPLRISYDGYKAMNLQDMKADDARVLAALGPVVARVESSQLIDIDRLAKPRIYLYPLNYNDYRSPFSNIENLGWQEARDKLIIKNSVIHRVSRDQSLEAARAGQTTLIIAGGSKELGLNIYNELRDANLNAVYLHGSIGKDFRNESRIRMSKNRLEACVATTIYDEGIDIPNLRQLILAYGGLSPIKNEQRLGRGLRNKIGTNEAIVIDFVSYGNKHLRKHSYARLKMYLEESAYSVYLVGNGHSRHAINLVGKKNIVKTLPDKKLFLELKHDGHTKRSGEEQKSHVKSAVQEVVREKARSASYRSKLPNSYDHSGRESVRSRIRT